MRVQAHHGPQHADDIAGIQAALDIANGGYEVILVDGHHPSIRRDPQLAWAGERGHRGRAERGLTSAGRKGRGMRRRGIGTEKNRPSIRSHANRGK